MESLNQTETAAPTPEQLLAQLEFEFARQRRTRASKPRNRAMFLAVAIFIIVVGATVTLIFAEHLLADLVPPAGAPLAAEEMDEVSRKF